MPTAESEPSPFKSMCFGAFLPPEDAPATDIDMSSSPIERVDPWRGMAAEKVRRTWSKYVWSKVSWL